MSSSAWLRWVLGGLVIAIWLRPAGAAAQTVEAATDPIQFPTPQVSHYLQGFVSQTSTTQVRVARFTALLLPAGWDLQLRAESPTLGSSPGYAKPVNEVEWCVSGCANPSNWYPLSTSYVKVGEGCGRATIAISFRMRLAWALDRPASATSPYTYQTNVRWRAVANTLLLC